MSPVETSDGHEKASSTGADVVYAAATFLIDGATVAAAQEAETLSLNATWMRYVSDAGAYLFVEKTGAEIPATPSGYHLVGYTVLDSSGVVIDAFSCPMLVSTGLTDQIDTSE